jgi:glycosyltransferase involved in cell wall biosynthesis
MRNNESTAQAAGTGLGLTAEAIPQPGFRLRVACVGAFPFSLGGGGPAARLRNLALALRLSGATPELFLVGPERMELQWESVPVHIREMTKSIFARRVYQAAMDEIRKEIAGQSGANRFDVMLFYNQDPGYAWQFWRTCRRARILFVQQYAEMHLAIDYPFGILTPYFLREWLHLHIMPHVADGAVVITSALRARVARRGEPEPLLLPTVAPLVAATARPPRSNLRILAVSQGARRDDLGLLLETMAVYRRDGGSGRLRIIGLDRKALERLRARLAELRLTEVVSLQGRIEESLYQAELNAADVHVLLRTGDRSAEACFPSRLAELCASAAPLVMSDVGDIRCYFENGRNAYLVPPGDAQGVAEVLQQIEANPRQASAVGLAGHELARQAFDPCAAGEKLTKYLHSLVARFINR